MMISGIFSMLILLKIQYSSVLQESIKYSGIKNQYKKLTFYLSVKTNGVCALSYIMEKCELQAVGPEIEVCLGRLGLKKVRGCC